MKQTLRHYLTLCGITAVVAGALVLAGWMLLVRKDRTAQGPPHPSAVVVQASAWKNEEHWAVDQMVRDIVEMLLFAAGEKPEAYGLAVVQEDPKAHRYRVTASGPRLGSPFETELVLQDHLWSPTSLDRKSVV
jgi:hypothetical protein